LQIWAIWLFDALLLDIADAVADQWQVPTESISIEMLFRGFYHFHQAKAQGYPADLIAYFTDPNNADLNIVKSIPQFSRKPPLDLSPYAGLTAVPSS
jgi:hypothetical protein